MLDSCPSIDTPNPGLQDTDPQARFEHREQLAREITTLAGHLNAGNYRFLKLLEEFDRDEGWRGAGIRSLAHWLNWQCGISHPAAREHVRVARALPALPLIDAAFEQGQISYSKVRAMTRVATPGNEEYLLDIARHGTAAHVERVVRRYRRCRPQEEDATEQGREPGEEHFYCYTEDEGSVVFGGRVSSEQGQLLLKALEAMIEDIDKNVSAETFEGEQETEQNVSAETFPRTGRATALVHIAEHYLATGGSGAKPLTSNEAYQVLVHVNANDAHPDNRVQGGHTCHDDDGRCVAPPVVRQLACDATQTTVLENERGEVLNIGRRSRVVPRRIARALRIRDGGCRFPGCGQRHWTDAHHIRHWMDGGETSLDNLITLCRFHHRSLHRGEYWIERGTGSEVIFRDPEKRCIETSLYPQFQGSKSVSDRVGQLRNEHDRQGLQIDAHTAVTAWAGEVMDDAMAIEGLLQSDGVVLGVGARPE